MISSAQPQTKRTIFLDSCGIIYLSYFVRTCIELSESPATETVLLPETYTRHGWKRNQLEFESLRKGKKVFDHIVSEIGNGSDVFVTMYSELELIHLLTERQADNNLCDAGIPYRLRLKKNALLCLYSMELTDYEGVNKEYEEYRDFLRNHGAEYQVFETVTGQYREIMQAANVVMSNIMLNLPDAVIYGAAIIAEADEFLTSDGELKTIINSLRTESGMKTIKEKFIKDLAVQKPAISTGGTSLPFTLPEGKGF